MREKFRDKVPEKRPFWRQGVDRSLSADCVVVDAVCSEPLSATRFPVIRENTGNFIDFGHLARESAPNDAEISGRYEQIPVESEQGIFEAKQRIPRH